MLCVSEINAMLKFHFFSVEKTSWNVKHMQFPPCICICICTGGYKTTETNSAIGGSLKFDLENGIGYKSIDFVTMPLHRNILISFLVLRGLGLAVLSIGCVKHC